MIVGNSKNYLYIPVECIFVETVDFNLNVFKF